MSVDGEFKRLTAKDRLCAAVLKAVRENDTAALRRLGLGGFAQYAGRLSELMTASVCGGLDWSPDFAALMRQVNSPVRYAHHLVNESGAAIQQALDERNGVRLRVVEPEFNDGRTKAIVGEAAESDSEHAADNLATQLGTEVKDAGNEFMKQNAEQRSRAGFKVTVERTGGTNCCPWCADRIGRWELKDAPKDVFGAHDKCTCMVTYTDGRGVSTQANAAAGKWLWHPIEQNTPPFHVLTDGEKRGAGEPKRLTKSSAGDIIESESKWLPRKDHMSLEQFHELRDYGAQYGIAFSGLKRSDSDPALIREAIDSAQVVLSRYPELKESQFGQIIFHISQTMDNADYAFINPDTPNVIHLNANAYRDKETLKADYNKLVESRFFPKGTSYNSISVHELGHLYQHVHEISNEDILSMARQAAQVDTNAELLVYLERNLSGYSAQYDEGTEIISEVFSDYFTSDNPTEFSQRFMKNIEERR